MKIAITFTAIVFFKLATILVSLNTGGFQKGWKYMPEDPLTSNGFEEEFSVLEDPSTSDDNGEFDLYDIITLSEASLDVDLNEMTDEDREQTKRVHNVLRGNFTGPIAPGSDVHYMEYNMTLENSAKLYASMCRFEHGRHPNDTIGFKARQNLYRGWTRSIPWSIVGYYSEYPLFSYELRYCTKTKQIDRTCGHFMTVMWGRTHQVGCARKRCANFNNNYFGVCHYWPKGNFYGINFTSEINIYQIGRPCSRNPRGDGNLCHKNLCINKTLSRKYNLDYTCESFCQNCAVHNPETCTCECKVGWDFNDCAEPCQNIYKPSFKSSFVTTGCNTHENYVCPVEEDYKTLNKSMRNYKRFCEGYFDAICKRDDGIHFFYNLWCREFCKECEVFNPEKPPPKNRMCCGGKMCDRFYVLNDKCECELLCPSIACRFNSTDIKRPDESSTTSVPDASYSFIEKDQKLFLIITFIVYYALVTRVAI